MVRWQRSLESWWQCDSSFVCCACSINLSTSHEPLKSHCGKFFISSLKWEAERKEITLDIFGAITLSFCFFGLFCLPLIFIILKGCCWNITIFPSSGQSSFDGCSFMCRVLLRFSCMWGRLKGTLFCVCVCGCVRGGLSIWCNSVLKHTQHAHTIT